MAAAAAAQAVCCSVPEDGWLLSVMAPYSSTGQMQAVLFDGLCWLEILQEARVRPGAGGACPPLQPILSAPSSTLHLAVGLTVSLLSKFGQDSSFESLVLPHAVLVELHSRGCGDSKDLTEIEPGFALIIAAWVSFQFELMDVHSCWVCVVAALLDVGVGVVDDPAPAKSLVLSPAGAGTSARSLLSVRREGAVKDVPVFREI